MQSGLNFVVNATGDNDDGLCDTSDCTLREAINAANSNADASIITFSSLFNSAQTISLSSGLPAITTATTITGPGAKLLTVRGRPSDNNLDTIRVMGGVNATFSDLTISKGFVGIKNDGTLTLTNCAISNNDIGIENNSTLTATNCTISGSPYGGLRNKGTMTGTNCTFSNEAEITNHGTTTLTNCTISGNRHGIFNWAGTTTLKNSIYAGNTFTSSSIIDGGNNIIGGTAAEAGLAPTGLQDNGGPTKTIALVSGSPAISAGSNALIPAGITTDQRGSGFPRIRGGAVDIGAFEFPDSAHRPGPNFIVNSSADHDDGVCSTSDCTLREAINAANSNANASSITFSSLFNSAQTISVSGSGYAAYYDHNHHHWPRR